MPFKLDYQYDEMQKWIKQREEELDGVQLDIEDAIRSSLNWRIRYASLHRAPASIVIFTESTCLTLRLRKHGSRS